MGNSRPLITTVPCGVRDQAGDGAKDGGFAGAGFADQAQRVAGWNAKRHIAGGAYQRGAGAVSDGDAFEFDQAAAPDGGGKIDQPFGIAPQLRQLGAAVAEFGKGVEQTLGVGMSRFVQPAGIADLDDLAGVHHQHPVAER